MAKVAHLDPMADLVSYLSEEYNAGNIKGCVALIVKEDGTYEARWTDAMDWLTIVGLLETTKMDLHLQASIE